MADLSISVDNPIHSSPLGVISSASMTGPARAKMDELFCSWLALPETAGLVNGWISDLKAGKPLVPPKISTPSLRVSPVRHAPPGSPTRVGPAAAGFSPPLSPSRYAQRPSPTIGRFGFGDDSSPGPMSSPGSTGMSAKLEGVAEPFPSLAAAAAAGGSSRSRAPSSPSSGAGITAAHTRQAGSPGSPASEGAAPRSPASARHGSPATATSPAPARTVSTDSVISPSLSFTSTSSARAAAEAAQASGQSATAPASQVIPRFFRRGEGGRGRGRPLAEDQLEARLASVVATWRTHWLEARKQAAAAAKEEGGANSAAAKLLESIVAAPSTEGSPMERVAGVEVAEVDASLGLPVEQFAAVAKTLCGFPSFFAAPLFRRIRRLFGRASKGVAPGMPPFRKPEGSSSSSSSSSESKDSDADASTPASPGRAGAPSIPPFAASPSLGCPTSVIDVVSGDPDAADDGADADIAASGYDEETGGVVRLRTFLRFWRTEIEPLDHAGRFFNLVAQRESLTTGPFSGRRAIVTADFMPYLEELLAFHPGLAFLESTPEFQEKYARTVVGRIMFELDPEGTGAISERALRRSDLLRAFHTVDMEEDINMVTRFFSYEHFYVLYCKFWELDADHDFLLAREDLSKLPDLTHVVLDRVFSGAGRRITCGEPGRMGYEDFVCFFLAEEDKTSETAIRYWFSVCDVDGDRVISPPDIAYFYKQQYARMLELTMEPVRMDDVITQMTDLLKPDMPGHFTLKDFLDPTRVKLTGVFFSTLFNLNKFQLFESKEPVLVKQELNQTGITQWDRYASVEYMRLAEEEEEDEAAGAAVLGGRGGQGVQGGMGAAVELGEPGPWQS